MKIEAVSATPYAVPVGLPESDVSVTASFVVVRLAGEGTEGHGVCIDLGNGSVLAEYVERVLGPTILGEDVRSPQRIWTRLLREHNHWRTTGMWSSAVSAIDTAVWDLRGRELGCSVAQLLGGARDIVPTYVTFGATEYSETELAAAARALVDAGHRGLKMVVGGLQHASADDLRPRQYSGDPDHRVRVDARRVAAVREAIGPDVRLLLDGNCAFDLPQARRLCAMVEDLGIGYFEEPVAGNDPHLLRDLRASTSVPIAAGQFEGTLWAHARLVEAGALDVVQPNVVHAGGYTATAKIAALAESRNLRIETGGSFPHHNLHLHAGVENGGGVEYHWAWWRAGEILFDDPPTTAEGVARVPDRPGLGFSVLPAEELQRYETKAG